MGQETPAVGDAAAAAALADELRRRDPPGPGQAGPGREPGPAVVQDQPGSGQETARITALAEAAFPGSATRTYRDGTFTLTAPRAHAARIRDALGRNGIDADVRWIGDTQVNGKTVRVMEVRPGQSPETRHSRPVDVPVTRDKVLAVGDSDRLRAAVMLASRHSPGDEGTKTISDVAGWLRDDPGAVFPLALQHAPHREWADGRAADAEAVTAVLDGVPHADRRITAALGEYGRQLRAALAEPPDRAAARNRALARGARRLAGQVTEGPGGGAREHLETAAVCLAEDDRRGAWSHLELARESAAGNFSAAGLAAVHADGTAAHEHIAGLMQRLAPAVPAAGGSIPDRLHAGDLDKMARDAAEEESPGGEAIAARLRGAGQALRDGDHATAVALLGEALDAARQVQGTLGGVSVPRVEACLARAEARRAGRRDELPPLAVQAAAYSRAWRDLHDPGGPPMLTAIARSPGQAAGRTDLTAVDQDSREYQITIATGAAPDELGTVTVARGGETLTAPAGHDFTRTARELAGRLSGTWRPRTRRKHRWGHYAAPEP